MLVLLLNGGDRVILNLLRNRRAQLERTRADNLTVAIAEEAVAATADALGPYDVDELPNLKTALAEANARSSRWSPRADGLCLACNGGQHEACEGPHAAGGPCECYDRIHIFGAESNAPVRPGQLVDAPGTHRSCREAAARVCACCAPLIAAAVGAGGSGGPAEEDASTVAVLGCMACGEDSQGYDFCVQCDIREDTRQRRREDRLELGQ